MPGQKASRVIVDTNLWISFQIGKELHYLKDLIVSEKIKLITTDQLINEIKLVTSREKLKKYFNQDKVADLISLLMIISEKVEIKTIEKFAAILKTTSCLLYAKRVKLIT